ncbi:leucine-rich repeat domain-containing protein [Alkalibacter mobilis]|uniref:leucine-rich repeat domain-containing protein n=1 Tax=Alkalibacter mobilis TaxID=2787712 RepID=UPI0018A0C82B|nr:leucine-rich repeat domain-containing protein [Alkalibacter mobilis]MBF7096257.1 leucine-rich repeat domain-containing protein [Alkalibacter mobilis]
MIEFAIVNNEAVLMACKVKKSEALMIPDEYKNLKVVKISPRAFENCSELKEVELPEFLKEIGDWAFAGCTKLRKVTFKGHIGKIGANAFYGCEALEEIHLPSTIKIIEKAAFSRCISLKKVTLPDQLERLGWYVFSGCTQLEEVVMNQGIKHLGGGAFKGCMGMKEVDIPKSLTDIGPHAFEGCNDLERIKVSAHNTSFSDLNGILFDKNKKVLKTFPPGISGGYTVPDGVEAIKDESFWGCEKLTGLKLGNDVKKMGHHALNGCKLVEIDLPCSLTQVGEWAFGDCPRLEKITIEGDCIQDPKVLKELKKVLSGKMILNFSGGNNVFQYLFDEEQRLNLTMGYCSGKQDVKNFAKITYDNYAKEHFDEIFNLVVKDDSVEGTAYFGGNDFYSRDISEMIERANKRGAVNVLMYLMEYKNKNFGLDDILNKLDEEWDLDF